LGERCPVEPLRTTLRVRLVAPHEGCERTRLVDEIQGTLGVVDYRFDLAAMAHDAGIGEAAFHLARSEVRDLGEIESGEGRAKVLALAQNCDPREPGLEAFQAKLLEEAAVVGDRSAPFAIVIAQIECVGARPPAARPPIRALDHAVRKTLHVGHSLVRPALTSAKDMRGILILMALTLTRRSPLCFAAALLLSLASTPTPAFTDAELVDGFRRTVFGSEYPSWGWQADIVKKFVNPVRVYVDDRSREQRGDEVARFVRSLPGLVDGLNMHIVASPSEANFRVFVVDRKDYRNVVVREVYGRQTSTFAPGRCLVRVVSTAQGIVRSDAVIVADEGDSVFHRCTVEEVLQGLGPINDDRTLDESVFNDSSRHTTFTRFDRHLVNMLYDTRVRPGMSEAEVGRVLPAVAAAVRARLK
jgi:Protein of unknown function (DUF2927)